jgi:glyceraldehyde 3-phosphate dehydrogenase
MPIRIAINGFGRIGRCILRIALNNPKVEVVAINDLMTIENASYLLQYDTAYGILEEEVSHLKDKLIVGENKITYLSEKEPSNLPWKKLDVDIVMECTGRFVKDGLANVHLKQGAKKVILSAPAKGEFHVPTILMGVNHEEYDGSNLISNASCTTNCIAPVLDVMHKKFGVKKAIMNTIHATTNTEAVVDTTPPGGGSDLRRGRASGHNMVPTTTGAAIAATKAIPELTGKFDGTAVRVPIIVGSLSDIVMHLEKNVTVEEVNNAFVKASKDPYYKNVLAVSIDENLVSSDIIRNTYSTIVDLELTKVVGGDLVKVFAWYDNEWGYSCRMIDLALHVSKVLK